MDESSSSATEADEDQPDRSQDKSQARIVGVHPLYLLLPRQIPSLLPTSGGSSPVPENGIPVTGESEGVTYTSRFVTPYIRQDRAYTAGILPPLVLENIRGERTGQ